MKVYGTLRDRVPVSASALACPDSGPGGGRVDLDEPGGTALAYQAVLAEGRLGESGLPQFSNPSGQHRLGPCLDLPVAEVHMLQVLEQLAEVKSRFGQWATPL